MKSFPALLAAIAAWVIVIPDARAQAGLPTIQAVEGSISPQKAKKPVSAASSDELILINKATARREGAAFSIDRDGHFLLVITKDGSFNSTPLTLRLRKGGDIYKLLDIDTSEEVEFLYAGTLLGGGRLELDLRIGAKVASATTGTGGGPPPPLKPVNTNPKAVTCSSPKYDVNGDGKCDEADIEQIQNYLVNVSRDPRAKPGTVPPEDVNGDGVVSARDLIEAARALQQARLAEARKQATMEREKIERPDGAARPGSDLAKELEAARKGASQRPTRPQ